MEVTDPTSQVLLLSSHKKEKVRSDSSCFEDFKLSVIKKALAVKNNAGSPTIGPLAKSVNEREGFNSKVSQVEESVPNKTCPKYCTSTPISKKTTLGFSSSVKRGEDHSRIKLIPTTMESPPSVKRLLCDYEKYRQYKIDVAMQQRIVALEERENEWGHRRELLYAEWRAQVHAKELAREKAILLQLEEEDKLAGARRQQIQEQQELQAKRVSLRNERLKAEQKKKEEEEEEKRLEEKRTAEKFKHLEEMQQIQRSYCLQYQAILNFIRVSKDKQVFINHISNLKSYNEGMEQLIHQCKDNVSVKDIERASTFLKQLVAIHDDLKAKIEEQLRREEEEQREIDNKAKAEVEGKPEVEEQSQPTSESQPVSESQPITSDEARKVGDAIADCVDKRNLHCYLKLIGNQQKIEKSYEPLMNDDSLEIKKFRFECQKAINIPVNAISSVSSSHLTDKLTKLSRLLSGKSVATSGNSQISASAHPSGIVFCQDILAKKFVQQGNSTVSSKPEAAFAIAAVIVALWQEFPSWGELVIAHFYNKCPYLVPFFKPQLEGQTTKDYYKSLGYLYSEDGQVEEQDKFLKRMSGIMRLYAAILITTPPRSRSHIPHPYGIENGWRWLSSILNLEPRPDVCATLIYDFLEVAGHSMYKHYGRQFQKLLVFLCKEYFPLLQKVSGISSGPVTRLENFLQQILREGRIERPTNALRPDFW